MADITSNVDTKREDQAYELKDLLNPVDSFEPGERSVNVESQDLSPKNAPSRPLETLEKIFTMEEQTNIKVFMNSITKGIPTSFTYADYYYCILHAHAQDLDRAHTRHYSVRLNSLLLLILHGLHALFDNRSD